MDMIKVLSIEGFVDYYRTYCAKTDELSKERKTFKKSGELDKAENAAMKTMDLVHELAFMEEKYSLLCTMREIEKALAAYPENSREHMAVEIIREKKQKKLDTLGF